MANRVTLPQQRAQETRGRIIDAAARVFARVGYGQAAVEEILIEAGISRGAFYHHFAGKEELFKGLLDDHLQKELQEFATIAPAASFREMVDGFVAFQIGHLQGEDHSGPFAMELWAQAAREEWTRTAAAEFHRGLCDGIARVLTAGQSAGVVRSDLDARGAALLLVAIFEGVGTLRAIDPERVDLERLKQPWADLIERFTAGAGGDVSAFGEQALAFFRAPDEPEASAKAKDQRR